MHGCITQRVARRSGHDIFSARAGAAGLCRLQVGSRRFASLRNDVIADSLAFHEAAQFRLLDGANMYEHVRAAIFRLDESISFRGVKPLYGSCSHGWAPGCPHANRVRLASDLGVGDDAACARGSDVELNDRLNVDRRGTLLWRAQKCKPRLGIIARLDVMWSVTARIATEVDVSGFVKPFYPA